MATDPFALEKTAIDQLETMPNNLDPTTVYIPVFNRNTSTVPMKATQQQLYGSGEGIITHREADLYEITSTSINVIFEDEFDESPINTESIKVYKYVDGYKYYYLIADLNVLTSGFTGTVLDVDPDVTITDFTGIILEYCLFERT